jgi:hypothetical protein
MWPLTDRPVTRAGALLGIAGLERGLNHREAALSAWQGKGNADPHP